MASAAALGPAPDPAEQLPSKEVFVLAGHEGAVLNVRFNTQGTYCLSCGKARSAAAAPAARRGARERVRLCVCL
jgi:hypothetical protein